MKGCPVCDKPIVLAAATCFEHSAEALSIKHKKNTGPQTTGAAREPKSETSTVVARAETPSSRPQLKPAAASSLRERFSLRPSERVEHQAVEPPAPAPAPSETLAPEPVPPTDPPPIAPVGYGEAWTIPGRTGPAASPAGSLGEALESRHGPADQLVPPGPSWERRPPEPADPPPSAEEAPAEDDWKTTLRRMFRRS